MHDKGWLLLRTMLNRFHPKGIDPILKLLPQEDAQNVKRQQVTENAYTAILSSPSEWISRIHYSWLQPAFEKENSIYQNFFFSLLPESQSKALSKLLNINISQRFSFSPIIKQYFTQIFYQKLELTSILPIEFLPDSPLNSLLKWNKSEIVQLIDFLGLHDLAEEIRFIVDKKKIKVLYEMLTPKKQEYLKFCLGEKEQLSAPRLGLDKWIGPIDKLEGLLHKRGLARLSKAIENQHPDFKWYLTHILDIGRGKLLQTTPTGKENPTVVNILIQQVIMTMNFLKQDK